MRETATCCTVVTGSYNLRHRKSLNELHREVMTLKIKPSDLRLQAAAMIRDGSMPPLEAVLKAVADARKKYSGEIKATRKHTTKRAR
jgi:hypothetical protein